jgi:NADPH:quinone reductase-like Zn-dependent oxidoreductase
MPETMKAVVIKDVVEDCKEKKDLEQGLKVEQVKKPTPSYNQVLIKVQRTQINPSDLAFIKGYYGKKGHKGEIPGFECAGTVVDHGASPFAWLLMGKRVAAYTRNCWAEYIAVDANNCLVLNDSVSWESGAGAMINPFTVMLMLDICAHEKVVVITAGTSDLSKKFVRAANTKGIKTIAIVSQEGHADLCQKNGAIAVLNSESQEYEQQLTQLCHENHVRIAFDPVGGETGTAVLSALINGGEIYEIGMLSGQPIQPSLGDLVFKGKCVKGLWLNSVFDMNMFKLLKMKNDVAAMLESELKSETQATYPLEQIADAICTYTEDQAAGKVQLIIGDAEEEHKKEEGEQKTHHIQQSQVPVVVVVQEEQLREQQQRQYELLKQQEQGQGQQQEQEEQQKQQQQQQQQQEERKRKQELEQQEEHHEQQRKVLEKQHDREFQGLEQEQEQDQEQLQKRDEQQKQEREQQQQGYSEQQQQGYSEHQQQGYSEHQQQGSSDQQQQGSSDQQQQQYVSGEQQEQQYMSREQQQQRGQQ